MINLWRRPGNNRSGLMITHSPQFLVPTRPRLFARNAGALPTAFPRRRVGTRNEKKSCPLHYHAGAWERENHFGPGLAKSEDLDSSRILSRSHAPAWECSMDAPASLSRNAGALPTAFPRGRVGTRK